MTRALLLFFVLFACASMAAAERPRPLGWALDAMSRGNWEAAERIAARDGAVAQDVIVWHRLRAGEGSYREVVEFLEQRPDWPGEELLRRRSEPVVVAAGQRAVLAFFAEMPAQTPEGILAHSDALRAAGEIGLADALLVEAWLTLPMGSTTQRAYLADHRGLLEPFHALRLDALLWQRATTSAQLMFSLVSDGQVALARARMSLQARSGDVDARIAEVPEALSDDAGLAHDRFEWRVRKGFWESAKELLLDRSESAEALGEPASWANRRRSLARDEMRDGEAARAYAIASQHFLVEGIHYADLEWLSGFIALRLLNQPERALAHFENHRDATKSPISSGRAGYWIGRAHEALGNSQAAAQGYAYGAQFQTSFYGLLAAEAAGLPFDEALSATPAPDAWKTADFAQSDLFQAGLLLQASGALSLAERFWTHLAEGLSDADAELLGQAAIDTGQPHLAVMIGKRVARRGVELPAPYYALHPLAEAGLNMSPEMLLAIARRESEFDPVVQSGVGARGLMQIMPDTGRQVASSLGLRADHTTERLITDPVYNARLGAQYLAQLAQTFDGNPIMMAAGYNAGPSRPTNWMERFGDPRRGAIDIVDWIELMPFRETRNYVMRVSESLPVYRARLGLNPLPVPFSQELVGSSLNTFTPEGE